MKFRKGMVLNMFPLRVVISCLILFSSTIGLADLPRGSETPEPETINLYELKPEKRGKFSLLLEGDKSPMEGILLFLILKFEIL